MGLRRTVTNMTNQPPPRHDTVCVRNVESKRQTWLVTHSQQWRRSARFL